MEFSVISKSEPCFVIQESLTKLASSLTPKVLFPYFMPFITQNIQSNVWSAAYASYICIGALAQGSSKFFMNELDQLMNYILSGFNSTDPRIIYISLVTVGILALEYSVRYFFVKITSPNHSSQTFKLIFISQSLKKLLMSSMIRLTLNYKFKLSKHF